MMNSSYAQWFFFFQKSSELRSTSNFSGCMNEMYIDDQKIGLHNFKTTSKQGCWGCRNVSVIFFFWVCRHNTVIVWIKKVFWVLLHVFHCHFVSSSGLQPMWNRLAPFTSMDWGIQPNLRSDLTEALHFMSRWSSRHSGEMPSCCSLETIKL